MHGIILCPEQLLPLFDIKISSDELTWLIVPCIFALDVVPVMYLSIFEEAQAMDHKTPQLIYNQWDRLM